MLTSLYSLDFFTVSYNNHTKNLSYKSKSRNCLREGLKAGFLVYLLGVFWLVYVCVGVGFFVAVHDGHWGRLFFWFGFCCVCGWGVVEAVLCHVVHGIVVFCVWGYVGMWVKPSNLKIRRRPCWNRRWRRSRGRSSNNYWAGDRLHLNRLGRCR